MLTTIAATGAILLGSAQYAAAQALTTPAGHAPEPLVGLVLGLTLIRCVL